MEFHISRRARDHYQFDQSLFSFNGNVIFANFHAVRLFSQKMNQQRDLVNFPEQAVRAGELNAMGLIDEILHMVIQHYREQRNPRIMEDALEYLTTHIGAEQVYRALHLFTAEFPPQSVYLREQTVEEYLAGTTGSQPNTAVTLEEMIMLWVANQNPANAPFFELFDDAHLAADSAYSRIMVELNTFFDTQPRFGPGMMNLLQLLRAPALANPHSLFAQLEFLRERWSGVLGRYLYRLLSSLDFLKEEQKVPFTGPGPVAIPVFTKASVENEPERFSMDREWMPRLVMIAKNSYVWLDQLSRKYQRSITRLDQIPDEELDTLAQWGITGLWLIGLWERSHASARIKQLTGNPDAVASAYSLWNYDIAQDLGGDEAYRSLRDRAWQRGIRLASDMVPNHMGIDSPWVIEHPDWFLSLDFSPYPSYSFNGPDLSQDERVGVFLEDHYYDHTDASVVFKRVDRYTGSQRFIYHGNDGTSMPWNDTAQLNYLNPAVREAVIQTILHVARKFPIIRFDAAMTLAKKHVQRLWFPEPGSGGAIPSRSEFGMTKEQFDNLMPTEFWRDVVDRVAVEAPDTLLLAEAFWLMEGYFVRTLGMHRVYNSAFMNLLRNEDNAKYRMVMKNTLEFDPEILKRYVNFMNNPDERTAVDQFGKGDKYFGICILMITMPGLPMFGHGQVQGFSEKYGMEFRRALWDEQPDPHLIERHEREIFPLLHRRTEFSGVENFLLYDFYNTGGGVNEDVFAYSNGLGDARNLVVYNNRFSSARGWVRTSAAFMDKNNRTLRQQTLGDGLNLRRSSNTFTLFRDSISGLEYLIPTNELIDQGFYVQLDAYKYHVFVDFRQVEDDQWHSLRQIHAYLQGRGVPSIQEAMRELLLQPVQQPFREIANPGYFRYLLDCRLDGKEKTRLPDGLLDEARQKMNLLLDGIARLTGENNRRESLLDETLRTLEAALNLRILDTHYPMPAMRLYPAAVSYLTGKLADDPLRWLAIFAHVFTHRLGLMASADDPENQAVSWFDEWQFGRILIDAALAVEISPDEAEKLIGRVRLLIGQQSWFNRLGREPLAQVMADWLSDSEVRRFIGVNRYQEILWYNREAFQDFLWWMMLIAVLQAAADPRLSASDVVERTLTTHDIILRLLTASTLSDYQIEKLLAAVADMEQV